MRSLFVPAPAIYQMIIWAQLLADPAGNVDVTGPLAPAESRAAIRLADPNLMIELVLSEPAINSPVAMTWDADERLYVVEMSDYPTAETGGKIKLFQDLDRDGVYEKSSTFVEGLKFPTGALAWNGGLLVTCAPEILFFKDADGDGRAEERRVILTGFAEGNQQLRVNGLLWGLDNWVYGANGRSGGEIRRPQDASTLAVPIRRHDFRFRPATGEFQAIAGFSQFGLGRDDFNHRFLSWNTVPLRYAAIEEQDLNRNPHLTSGNSIALITEASDTGRVFPISAVPKTFNRERTDYFNASCGTMIFRGDGLGPNYRGNAFMCEPLTNLVHRKTLQPRGATFVATREEVQQEFLASTDRWCHPVNLATGPDGCLYLADFYREWVEHPQFVQEALRKSVNFRTGSDHGRIWRIRHKDYSPRLPSVSLATLSTAELAGRLNSENAWVRDTVQRLLVERQDKQAIPVVQQIVERGTSPVARACALWTLKGLNALRVEQIESALKDPTAEVREQGVILFRQQAGAPPQLITRLLELAADGHPRVRFQTALALGDLESSQALTALARIAEQDADDEWVRMAVLSGLGKTAFLFLQTLAQEQTGCCREASTAKHEFLRSLTVLIGARRQDAEIAGTISILGDTTSVDEGASLSLLSGLAEGLARSDVSLRKMVDAPSETLRPQIPALRRVLALAETTAMNPRAPETHRLMAFKLLVQMDAHAARTLLPSFLAAEASAPLQAAAAAGLAELGDAELGQKCLDSWLTYPINTRRELVRALVRQPALVAVLLDAVEQQTISPTEIDFMSRESLARVADPGLKARVAQLLKPLENSDREAVVTKYQAALELAGDTIKGAALFSRDCAGCHQVRGQGARVGPELSGVGSRPKAALLSDILNPSKEVSPDFVNYVVVTSRGQIYTGLLAADTATAIRLRRIQGAEDEILRTQIEELRPNGKSLMPDGFEEKLSPQDLAHLLEFLQRPVPPPATTVQ